MPEVPTLVCLHALGASRRSFAAVAAELGERFDVLAVDLPGFGDQSAVVGTSVAEMADHVAAQIRRHFANRPAGWGRWLLVGHSMGGKVATVVASRTMDGSASLFGLAGVVLLAGSPPSPEPMSDDKRSEMIGWASDGPLDEDAARSFIDANVGAALPNGVDAAELSDLRRASPEAWRAWLQRGSREDWSGEVGVLRIPALIMGGDADADLGAGAQRTVNGPVYPDACWQVLAGAGHLLPLERPVDVAAAIAGFWNDRAGLGPVVPPTTAATIASARTGARARAALARRMFADDPAYAPQALSPTQLAVLRVLADRVVPQEGPPIDLAARVDAMLAAGGGNGWRFAELPADDEAYRLALDSLAELPTLTVGEQDAVLARVAEGTGPGGGGLAPRQLSQWFEDAREDLVHAWLAHPASLARVGFDGYANGGDGPRLQGFTLLGLGEREAWEPVGAQLNLTAASTSGAGR